MLNSIAIFGGSFNPIHNMHINIALDVKNTFNFDKVELVPCHTPVHKDIIANSNDRVAMLKLAIRNYNSLKINTIELERGGPSYMIDTLLAIKKSTGKVIYLIIGSDSLNNFHKWKDWKKILFNCNLIIAPRIGNEINIDLDIRNKITNSISEMKKQCSGLIYIMPGIYNNTSSSEERRNIYNQDTKHNLDELVTEYINTKNLYSR